MPIYRWPQLDRAESLVTYTRTRRLKEASDVAEHGWISELLEILGMSHDELAKLLGVNQSWVLRVRQAEKDGRITTRKMREVADAMGADFVYALVHIVGFISTCHVRLEAMEQQRRWHKRLKPHQGRIFPRNLRKTGP